MDRRGWQRFDKNLILWLIEDNGILKKFKSFKI